MRWLTTGLDAELSGARADLEKLAAAGRQSATRQLGFVTLIAADGTTDRAWALAMKSIAALHDLLDAMPLIRDPGQRAGLYPKVEPLLNGLPKELQQV